VTQTGAALRRGSSRQDYGTPWELIRAVEAKYGTIHADLAATPQNAKAKNFLTPEEDSLTFPWSERWPAGTLWLNPPFSDIAPWAKKCAEEGPRRYGLIIMLTPASIGSNWFAEHVYGNARVLALSPRITFEGCEDPYPKDCMLSLFGMATQGFALWRWDDREQR